MLKDKFWLVLQLAWNVEWKALNIEPTKFDVCGFVHLGNIGFYSIPIG
jgi:hypothetical protein